VNWAAVPELPRGTWMFISLSCGHIRVRRGGEEIARWELILCIICAEYKPAEHAGIVRV